MKLTPKTVDQQCMYREFCKFLDKRFIRTFAKNQSSGINAALKSELQKELEQPLRKEASLNYIIRKAFELGLDLRKITVLQDSTNLNVISRARFQRMLENLPLGLLPFEIEEVFENDLNFDNYGNVDYTVILNSDLFVTLEREKLKKDHVLRKSHAIEAEKNQSQMEKLTDNRKVVVEDLCYIDDLEVIIYTTLSPKTSTIFVTHTKKFEKGEESKVEIVTLQTLSQ